MFDLHICESIRNSFNFGKLMSKIKNKNKKTRNHDSKILIHIRIRCLYSLQIDNTLLKIHLCHNLFLGLKIFPTITMCILLVYFFVLNISIVNLFHFEPLNHVTMLGGFFPTFEIVCKKNHFRSSNE